MSMPARPASRFLIALVVLAAFTAVVLTSSAMTHAVTGRYRLPVGTSSVGIGAATVDRPEPGAIGVAAPVASLAKEFVPLRGLVPAQSSVSVGQAIVVIGEADVPAGSTGTIVAVDDPVAPAWMQVVTGDGSEDWMPVESGLAV